MASPPRMAERSFSIGPARVNPSLCIGKCALALLLYAASFNRTSGDPLSRSSSAAPAVATGWRPACRFLRGHERRLQIWSAEADVRGERVGHRLVVHLRAVQ